MDQTVSGLYREVFSNSGEKKAKGTELDLRIDVDGERPMNVISGDIYFSSEGIREYQSSFIFEEINKTETEASRILITGKQGKFDPGLSRFSNIQVTIRSNSGVPEATVRWTSASGAELKCFCKFSSRYFRRVELEHDYEESVFPLESYEITNLPSPVPHKSMPLSISGAFAEAGIEIIIVKEQQGSIPRPKGKPGEESVWTDSKLHEAMLRHFSKIGDMPQWSVWLLSASEYVMSNIKGIMIGHEEKKRLGCAVFQDATGWQSAEEKRMRLFIYIHELGHCFNLRHPWDRSQANSSDAGGHSTLSWMNYPWMYCPPEKSYEGETFWDAFKFQFSDSELIHLRHGFRNDVIFGGNTFDGNSDSQSRSSSKKCKRLD